MAYLSLVGDLSGGCPDEADLRALSARRFAAADDGAELELGWVRLARGRGPGDDPGGPLRDPSGRFALLFDGFLDDRPGNPLRAPADAVLAAVVAGGPTALDRLGGSWAAVLVDEARREIHLARDPIGDRELCWALRDGRLLVASEPWPVAAAGVGARADGNTIAAWLAEVQPEPERTFFAGVQAVVPGERITVSAAGVRRHRYWDPPAKLVDPGSEDDLVAWFRAELAAAAERRLGEGVPAVLTSGGLDSTTLAALVAPGVARRGGRPLAVSWRFSELAAADESLYAAAVHEHVGLAARWVDGDGCWPLRDVASRAIDPNLPAEGAYRLLHESAYHAAREAGAEVLLTGHGADEAYVGLDADGLRDALLRGDLAEVVAGLRRLRAAARTPGAWTPGWSRSLGRTLPAGLRHGLRSLRPGPRPPWRCGPEVADAARGRVAATPHPAQAALLLAPFAAMAYAGEARLASRRGLALRFPYRDRALVERLLALPASALVRPGARKWLAWRASEGLLPAEVRGRRTPGNISALFLRGLRERERATAERLLLGDGPGLWRAAIREQAVRAWFEDRPGAVPGRILWRCIALELWARAVACQGGAIL